MGSGNYSKYSFTSSAGDVDFYGNDPLYPKILATSESDLTVAGTRVALASASVSGSGTLSSSALEIQLAQPDFSGDLAAVTVAIEIQIADIFLDGDVNFAANATKFAYAAASLSGSGTSSIIVAKLSSASAYLGNFHAGGPFTSTSSNVGGAYLIDPSYLSGQADYISVNGVSESMGLILDALTNGDTISVAAGLTTDGEEGVFEIDYTSYDAASNEVIMFGNITSGSDIVTQNGVTDSVIGNYDLYGATLTSSAVRIKEADSTLSGSLTLSATSTRIPAIALSVSGSGSLSASSLKIAFGASDISDGDGSLSATSFKFAHSESQLSGDGSLVATSLKQALAQSDLSSSASTSITALEILFAAGDLSSTLTSVIVGREILYANTSIDITSDFLVAGVTRFSPSILEDVETIRTLISIDNKPLSEHNRKLNSNVIQSFVENRNWASTRSRYYKSSSGRRTFSINWTMLPSLRDQTVDKRFGRDKVREIATDPDVHTLKLLNFDSDGTTPYTETEYNVLVKSYSENLIRRDINNDMYLWDCSIELEEV